MMMVEDLDAASSSSRLISSQRKEVVGFFVD